MAAEAKTRLDSEAALARQELQGQKPQLARERLPASYADERCRTQLTIQRFTAIAMTMVVPALALANEEAHFGEHGHGGLDQTAIIASIVNFVALMLLLSHLFKDKMRSYHSA